MKRIIEPELMIDKVQAEAYANADFEQAHKLIVNAFDHHFPDVELVGRILDLGCGPGDISFRFATRFPGSEVLGVDGSAEMIKLANERKDRKRVLSSRLTFIKETIPCSSIPEGPYSAVVSNSLLHHLHQPQVLWQTLIQYSSPGTKILITDLFRPENSETAQQIVNESSANEPDILRRDFYNSLLAAFTREEIEQQLADAGLTELEVKEISNRHVLIFGEKRVSTVFL